MVSIRAVDSGILACPRSLARTLRRGGDTPLLVAPFADIVAVLARIERLAEDLHADPDGHVRRSANELRAVFDARGAVEPAVARVREGVRMVRRGNEDGPRREFRRRAHNVDHLANVVERELIPHLRRIGFEV